MEYVRHDERTPAALFAVLIVAGYGLAWALAASLYGIPQALIGGTALPLAMIILVVGVKYVLDAADRAAAEPPAWLTAARGLPVGRHRAKPVSRNRAPRPGRNHPDEYGLTQALAKVHPCTMA